MTINSRPELSTTQKVQGSRTYRPLVLSDEAVYNMAQHYYTVEEIAERFNVSRKTILEHHGDAYNAGKADAMQKPRMLLRKIFTDFEEADVNFANPNVPMGVLLKAMDYHARKYEGLGSTQTIVHKEEQPSVSDIKFVPLTKDD